MKHTNLKSDFFIVGKNTENEKEVERYLVENIKDLDTFFNVFELAKHVLYYTILNYVKQGERIILTDNTVSGFPSWCTVTEQESKTIHPSTHHQKL